MPEYWHPNSVEWLTGKLSVNQNLNPRDDVVLLSYMCMFTKLKQSAELQTAVEQPLSKKRKDSEITVPDMEEEFFLNSDGIRVDKMQYNLAYGS